MNKCISSFKFTGMKKLIKRKTGCKKLGSVERSLDEKEIKTRDFGSSACTKLKARVWTGAVQGNQMHNSTLGTFGNTRLQTKSKFH